MPESQSESTKWGRPHMFGEQSSFNLRQLSSDLVQKIDRRIEGTAMSRRVYLEHLLRTHPELQGDNEK